MSVDVTQEISSLIWVIALWSLSNLNFILMKSLTSSLTFLKPWMDCS